MLRYIKFRMMITMKHLLSLTVHISQFHMITIYIYIYWSQNIYHVYISFCQCWQKCFRTIQVTFVLKKVMTFQNGTFAQGDNVVKTMLASPGKKIVFDVLILRINRCPYKAGGGQTRKYINSYPYCLQTRVLTEPVYCGILCFQFALVYIHFFFGCSLNGSPLL